MTLTPASPPSTRPIRRVDDRWMTLNALQDIQCTGMFYNSDYITPCVPSIQYAVNLKSKGRKDGIEYDIRVKYRRFFFLWIPGHPVHVKLS